MPSRRDNRVSTRRHNNRQQAEDVTEVGSNQPNSGRGMTSKRDNRVSTRGRNNSQQAKDVTGVGSNQPNSGQVSTRDRNNSQQAEDVTEVGSNQPNNGQVPGNAWKRDKFDLPPAYNGSLLLNDLLYSELGHSEIKHGKYRGKGVSDNNSDGTNVPQTSPQGLIVANEPQPLRVRLQVYLQSISYSEIVAKGWIRSLDPDEVVGSEEIGPNWCQVDVQVAIKKDEYLVRRKYGLFIKVQDAIGAPVAWPSSLVSVVCEDD
ncbi:transposase, Tnp1/En/Spm-like protein [Tanacetum coccineum]